MATLEARGITAGYGRRAVISDLSLRVEAGSIVTLIGANGSGKSTIVKVMSRILAPSSGAVYLDGRALASLRSQQVARRLAILPQ
ncbi:MAG TPA: ABC transporter ATP-binding protein, partial [Spirochaetia bacterium]